MFTGTWEWLIILAVVLLLFGGSKLPKLGGALGESIKNFRKGIGEASQPSISSGQNNKGPTKKTSSTSDHQASSE